MANRCQVCPDEPRVAVEDWRSVWLGMPDGFYLEWGRCCGDKEFDEPVELTNGKTGEVKSARTPNELWAIVAGPENQDQWGKALWF